MGISSGVVAGLWLLLGLVLGGLVWICLDDWMRR